MVIYQWVIETPAMSAADTPIVAARRVRLKAWIDEHFDGSQPGAQARFLAFPPENQRINQGLLSTLLGGAKSFGEKQAEKLERLYKMPPGYLVKALDEVRPLQAASPSQSQSLTLDLETLRRATEYLEDQFRKRNRPFVASKHVDSLTNVYDFLVRTPTASSVVLNKRFGNLAGEQNEREGKARSTKQNDRGGNRGSASKARVAAGRKR